MRFAIYLVISECEHVEGFSTFARALPETMRASMLGWSSPYDLSTQYQTDRLDAAFTSILHSVSDVGAEVLALDGTPERASAICMLPSRIDAMREQLRLYTDELMRPSAYHEPFVLRGIYLTGDSSESIERVAALDSDPSTVIGMAQADWREPVFGGAAAPVEGGDTGIGAAVPGAFAARSRHDLLGQLSLQPAFLRDLFERKVFAERGLTRPSRTQHLSRPLLRRSLRYTTIGLLCIWGIGLVFASTALHQSARQWVDALWQLHRQQQLHDTVLQDGATPSSDADRQNTLLLLSLSQRFDPVTSAYVFMPGAWPIFDDLQRAVGVRLQRAFGESAVTTVQREIAARVATLTGSERDPGTGQLIVGADCRAPVIPNAATQRPVGLRVEDQPEMAALQGYVASLTQLQNTLDALQRLRRAATANADDLRLVIAYTLGTQPQGDLRRALPYSMPMAADSGRSSITTCRSCVRPHDARSTKARAGWATIYSPTIR